MLLCLITTVNYLDRQALAVTGPVIIREFGLSNTEFGFINSAFLLAYAFGHLMAGPFIDRVGTKRAFSVAVALWSVAGMLHAAGRGFASFLALRGLLGITEASNFPAALKAVAEWFPKSDRSLAVGVITAGPGLGAVIAPPLLGAAAVSYGWEAAFLLPGLAGFLWLWLWHAWYQRPEDHSGITREELELIVADRVVGDTVENAGSRKGWRVLLGYLRYREVWGLLLSRFTNDGAFYFFVTWLPTYLAQARDFDLREIAAFAWMPFLAADIGSLTGGWAAQRLIGRGLPIDAARKRLIWLGAVLVLVSLPAVATDSARTAIALIGLAMFAIQFKAANLFALPVDLFPAREIGRIWGLFGAVGSLGGMAFVAAVGWVSEHYSYGPVFWAVGITQILSAAFVSLLIQHIGPLSRRPA